MHTAVLEPYFVPETLKADVIFANMKKQKQPMAVMLDEYGGVTGIVHNAVTAFVTEALHSYHNLPLLPPCVVPEEDLCVLLPPELLLLSGFAVRVTVW